MPFVSALATDSDTLRALDKVCATAKAQLPGPIDLALLFFSSHHVADAQELAKIAQEKLAARCLLGCSGEAIVANDREVEGGPALCLWLARWKSPVELTPFHLTLEETSEGNSLLGWPDDLAVADSDQALVLLLGDPFTFPIGEFLQEINQINPGLRVFGGMASGGRQVGQNPLILGQQRIGEGAIGVLVQGPIKVRGVVSQGCRPIGKHFVITKAQDNIIVELGGKSPIQQLQELWQELPDRDRELVQQGLHIGSVINEYHGDFQRGDFLVRNVMGMDRQTGALAVTDRVRVGQTVQFHVRDANTADEDLHELLRNDMSVHSRTPGGALLFTCNGRGSRMFDQPNHDVDVIRTEIGSIPVAGFFAQGELGPVGGQNFIHGFTASVLLFED